MRDNVTDKEIYELTQRLKRFAELTDAKFKIPGTNIPIGLDALIGFVPVLGDIIGLLMSSYLLLEAKKVGVPTAIKIKMVINVLLDFAIGFVPVVGDIGDIGFRSNIRNMKLIIQHIQSERSKRNELPPPRKPYALYLTASIALLAFVILGFIALG